MWGNSFLKYTSQYLAGTEGFCVLILTDSYPSNLFIWFGPNAIHFVWHIPNIGTKFSPDNLMQSNIQEQIPHVCLLCLNAAGQFFFYCFSGLSNLDHPFGMFRGIMGACQQYVSLGKLEIWIQISIFMCFLDAFFYDLFDSPIYQILKLDSGRIWARQL